VLKRSFLITAMVFAPSMLLTGSPRPLALADSPGSFKVIRNGVVLLDDASSAALSSNDIIHSGTDRVSVAIGEGVSALVDRDSAVQVQDVGRVRLEKGNVALARQTDEAATAIEYQDLRIASVGKPATAGGAVFGVRELAPGRISVASQNGTTSIAQVVPGQDEPVMIAQAGGGDAVELQLLNRSWSVVNPFSSLAQLDGAEPARSGAAVEGDKRRGAFWWIAGGGAAAAAAGVVTWIALDENDDGGKDDDDNPQGSFSPIF
jgi:hypothetical protein